MAAETPSVPVRKPATTEQISEFRKLNINQQRRCVGLWDETVQTFARLRQQHPRISIGGQLIVVPGPPDTGTLYFDKEGLFALARSYIQTKAAPVLYGLPANAQVKERFVPPKTSNAALRYISAIRQRFRTIWRGVFGAPNEGEE